MIILINASNAIQTDPQALKQVEICNFRIDLLSADSDKDRMQGQTKTLTSWDTDMIPLNEFFVVNAERGESDAEMSSWWSLRDGLQYVPL